jgi:hypothetical protein
MYYIIIFFHASVILLKFSQLTNSYYLFKEDYYFCALICLNEIGDCNPPVTPNSEPKSIQADVK